MLDTRRRNVSLMDVVLKATKRPLKGVKQERVTTYKVVDADYVEAVTPTSDGEVVVLMRRGSLDLPSPERPIVRAAEDTAFA